MLGKLGVDVQLSDDNGPEFVIHDALHGQESLRFCFHEDGNYWRIMGYTERGYSDEIHKAGWKVKR